MIYEFDGILEAVRMDLYLNHLEAQMTTSAVIFFGVGDKDYAWEVPYSRLMGFGRNYQINVIVDAFRHDFGQLGA